MLSLFFKFSNNEHICYIFRKKYTLKKVDGGYLISREITLNTVYETFPLQDALSFHTFNV